MPYLVGDNKLIYTRDFMFDLWQRNITAKFCFNTGLKQKAVFIYYLYNMSFIMFFICLLNLLFSIKNKWYYLLLLLVNISIKYKWEIISR